MVLGALGSDISHYPGVIPGLYPALEHRDTGTGHPWMQHLWVPLENPDPASAIFLYVSVSVIFVQTSLSEVAS